MKASQIRLSQIAKALMNRVMNKADDYVEGMQQGTAF